jgi:TetR/AcrR family fatty acid metabolism transcriptional regulator
MSEPESPPPASDAAADRKKQILRAAVEVFAERGFHRTRVSDIARRAGVAYGLIYHYFKSKDHVLESVFEENWSFFLKVLRELEQAPEPTATEKLASIAALLIDALQVAPSVIRVVIQEVSRSDRFVHADHVSAFAEAFAVAQAIIERGQASGELDPSVDPQVAAYVFFGALETVCTGFMLKAIRCGTPEEAARVKASVNQVLLHGLRRASAPAEPRG